MILYASSCEMKRFPDRARIILSSEPSIVRALFFSSNQNGEVNVSHFSALLSFFDKEEEINSILAEKVCDVLCALLKIDREASFRYIMEHHWTDQFLRHLYDDSVALKLFIELLSAPPLEKTENSFRSSMESSLRYLPEPSINKSNKDMFKENQRKSRSRSSLKISLNSSADSSEALENEAKKFESILFSFQLELIGKMIELSQVDRRAFVVSNLFRTFNKYLSESKNLADRIPMIFSVFGKPESLRNLFESIRYSDEVSQHTLWIDFMFSIIAIYKQILDLPQGTEEVQHLTENLEELPKIIIQIINALAIDLENLSLKVSELFVSSIGKEKKLFAVSRITFLRLLKASMWLEIGSFEPTFSIETFYFNALKFSANDMHNVILSRFFDTLFMTKEKHPVKMVYL